MKKITIYIKKNAKVAKLKKKKRKRKKKKLGRQTFPGWTGLNNISNDKHSLYYQDPTYIVAQTC